MKIEKRMTREEAIAWLEDEKEYYETNLLPENDKGSTAYQMAIEALKQPEIIRCRDCEYYPYCEICESDIHDPNGFCSYAYRNKEVKNE